MNTGAIIPSHREYGLHPLYMCQKHAKKRIPLTVEVSEVKRDAWNRKLKKAVYTQTQRPEKNVRTELVESVRYINSILMFIVIVYCVHNIVL